MFDYKLVRVEKKLKRFYEKGILENKKIYLFGVSENTRQIIGILRTYGLEPAAVLDNDERKQGTYCSGVKVISLKNAGTMQEPGRLYIICSLYWKEMTAQLKGMGVCKGNIRMIYEDDTLPECLLHACLGKRIYGRLVRKYGKVPIFVCPYTGTGDIYLIGTFWRQYIEKNRIKDYVFVVISKACEKTAKLFDIKNIELLEKKIESSYLIRYYMLCPEEMELKLLNDSWGQIHTNPLEWFRGYKGLEFTGLFRRFVFDLPDTARPEHPVLKNADPELEAQFRKHRLQPGNTAVLSPYSNTLADLPGTFWEQLAEALRKAGFTVCTNSSGDREPAVEGTVPVFFPLHIAPQWIEKAGYFIGVRSGFCDIISGAKAKKVILYDSQDWFYNGSAFSYFSLKKMGLSEDAVELLFDPAEEGLCKRVMDALGVCGCEQ